MEVGNAVDSQIGVAISHESKLSVNSGRKNNNFLLSSLQEGYMQS